MIKKRNVRDRGGAAALHSCCRAAALCLLYLPLAVSNGRAFGQTQIDGGQMQETLNPQTGTSYTIAAADCGKLLSLASSGNVAVSIPNAGAGGLASGCWIDIQNTGSGTATFTSVSTVDGGNGFALSTNQGLHLISNGTAYFTQRGQGSGAGDSGALSIQSGGTALGPAATLNLVAGTGVSCVPQVNAGVMTFQCNADTAYLESKTNLQGATSPLICTSSSASGTVYTASCGLALTAYAANQTLFWFADVANTIPAPTLNIDTLGAVGLVRHDGTTLLAGDIKAGTLYRIWYDGSRFHVVEAGLSGVQTGSGAAAPQTIAHAIGYTFDGGGAALVAGATKYLTVPFACTISAWNMAVDTGTATVRTWKVATATGVPTVANTISTAGVSITTGTAIHSTSLSDFSTTSVAQNDIFAFNLSAVSGATQVNFIVECDQ